MPYFAMTMSVLRPARRIRRGFGIAFGHRTDQQSFFSTIVWGESLVDGAEPFEFGLRSSDQCAARRLQGRASRGVGPPGMPHKSRPRPGAEAGWNLSAAP